jgi:hypothetical protein
MKSVQNVDEIELIAYQLVELAIRLHKRGFIETYQQLIKTRDNLLHILDEEANQPVEQEDTEEKLERCAA